MSSILLSKHFDFSSIKNLFKAHNNYIATETIFLSQPSTHCLCTLGICGILQFFHCAHCELVCLKIKHLYGPQFLNTKRFTVFEDKIEIYFSLFLSFRDFFCRRIEVYQVQVGTFWSILADNCRLFSFKNEGTSQLCSNYAGDEISLYMLFYKEHNAYRS